MSDRIEDLAAAFGGKTDADTAQTAAENIEAFAEEYDEDLTSETVLDRFEAAPYADFSRAFNWLVGDLAADNEDCTDSRAFRLAGFGALAADPEIGA